MIIDCHTHWNKDWEQQVAGGLDQWVGMFRQYNIGGAYVMPGTALHLSEEVQIDNEAVCALRNRVKNFSVYPLVTGSAHQGMQLVDELRRCVEELGAAGFKFHTWLQGFSLAHPTFSEVCRLAAALRVPIFLHDGTAPFALPEQVLGLCLRHPDTLFISGHAGLLWNWKTLLHGTDLKNLMITLCGVHAHALEVLVKTFDPASILWGSDYGFGVADTIGYRMGLLQEARIPDALKYRILEENPKRLMNREP